MEAADSGTVGSPWRRRCLVGLVLAWGVQAIVIQSVLLRETQVLMLGSELAWGLVLFAWLLGVAVGGAAGGWLAPRLRQADLGLAIILLALGGLACAALAALRGARVWLAVAPGELLDLPTTLLVALAVVTPVGVPIGMAFPCAYRVAARLRRAERDSDHATVLGSLYGVESAGSLVGGAAFSFWAVERLFPSSAILLCLALTTLAAAALLASAGGRRRAATTLTATGVGLVLLVATAGETLHQRLVQSRWRSLAPGYELVAEAETPYQSLAVGKRQGQYTLYSDGQVAGDFPDPYTFVPLTHFWMSQHPSPKRVLLLGGGAEGLLPEILRHPVERVDYVEPDPAQMRLLAPLLGDAERRALGDARVAVHNVDARLFIKTTDHRFDVVIARLAEPTSAARARFYTRELFGELRRAMTPRSVLCMTATAAPGELSASVAEYLATLRETLRTAFPRVIVGWGDPAHVLAETAPGLLSTDPQVLAARYEQRQARSELFDPLWFAGATDWLEPGKLRQRAAALDRVVAAGDAEVSRDLRPVIYLQRLVLWDQVTGGRAGNTIARLRQLGAGTWVLLWCALGGIFWLVAVGRARFGAPKGGPTPVRHTTVWLSVASTGFATMALSLIWLFAFQSLYGYVYQRIGWIVALFMGGLVLGSAAVTRGTRHLASTSTSTSTSTDALNRRLLRGLAAIDLLVAALAVAAPTCLPALGRLQTTPLTLLLVEGVVSVLVALTGILGGAAFALAGGVLCAAAAPRAGSDGAPPTEAAAGAASAGSIVAADHAGACLGALLTGLHLVPVLGIATAAWLLAGLKVATAVLLAGSAQVGERT